MSEVYTVHRTNNDNEVEKLLFKDFCKGVGLNLKIER